MGCGNFRCPPHQVAEKMRRAIETEELKGWLEEVAFAIFDRKVCETFKRVLQEEAQS
jgi:O-acetyl-ADP-ribose deacetylase (regulator of RNase III)